MKMLRNPSVDRRFFQATADAMAGLGIDLDKLCATKRIANPLRLEGERLPLDLVSQVYMALEQVAADPAFIYVQHEPATHERASVLFALVSCCATPAEMVRMICRYSSIASDAVSYELTDEGDRLRMRVVPDSRVFVSLHQIEMAVWFMVTWLRQLKALTGISLACSVQYAHAPRFDQARYDDIYQLPVTFRADRTMLVFGGPQLHQVVPGHDERMLAYYRTQAERYEQRTLSHGDFPRRVAILFMQHMAFGKPDAADIAAQLHISLRSLQRRLMDEGSSWSQVTDEVRKMVACRELQQTGRPLFEIALLTGFSDPRAFMRAFRRWTGMTPAAYRKQVLEGKAA